MGLVFLVFDYFRTYLKFVLSTRVIVIDTAYVDKLLDFLFSRVVQQLEVYQQLRADIAIPPALSTRFVWPTPLDIASITWPFRTK